MLLNQLFLLIKKNVDMQMAISLSGVTSGAMLSVFTLGVCFPWANSKVSQFYVFKIFFIC